MSINIIEKIKKIYEENGNIIQYLRKENNRKTNSVEDILISYDFQAGSYIDFVKKIQSTSKIIQRIWQH